MKVKSRIFLGAGIAVFFGIVVALMNTYSDDLVVEDPGYHEEVDFSNEGAMDELAPEDRWMLKFIDPPAEVNPEDVFVFDCETVDRKTSSMTTYCADFGIAVWKIKWSTWSASGAEGSGIYMANDCDPNCAEGQYLEVPVNVYLSDLTTDGKNYFLNTATIVPKSLKDQKGPIVGKDGIPHFTTSTKVKGKEVSAEIWDIASYYREVPEMRMKLPD